MHLWNTFSDTSVTSTYTLLSAEVNFDPGYDWENVQLKVVGPDGRSQERSPGPLREGMRFSNSVHVPAGATETVSLLANERNAE